MAQPKTTGSAVKLWYDIHSPHSRAVYSFIKQAQLPITIEFLDMMKGEHKRPEFVEKSGGQLPLLEEGNFLLTESSAILMYLAETRGKTEFLDVNNITQLARVEWFFAWAPNNLYTPISLIVYNEVYGPSVSRTVDSKLTEQQKENLIKGLIVLEDHVAGNFFSASYIAGNSVTVADFAAVCFLDQMHLIWDKIEVSLERDFPKLQRWYERMTNLDEYYSLSLEWFRICKNRHQQLKTETIIQSSTVDPQILQNLKQALHNFFWNKEDSAVSDIFNALDLTKANKISLDDLKRITSSFFILRNIHERADISNYLDDEEVKLLFTEADVDNDGFINKFELTTVLTKHRTAQTQTTWCVFKVFCGFGSKLQQIVAALESNIKKNPTLNSLLQNKDIQKIAVAQHDLATQCYGLPVLQGDLKMLQTAQSLKLKEPEFDELLNIYQAAAKGVGVNSGDLEGFKYTMQKLKHFVVSDNSLEFARAGLHKFFWEKDDTQLNLLFDIFDKDNSGNIDHKEFLNTLEPIYKQFMEPAQLTQMFREADQNKSAGISRQEWKNAMRKYRSTQAQQLEKTKVLQKMGGQQKMGQITEKFFQVVTTHEQLKTYFVGKPIPQISNQFAIFMASITGGQKHYEGKQLDQIHGNLKLNDQHFTAFVTLFVKTATECGVDNEVAEGLRLALTRFQKMIVGK